MLNLNAARPLWRNRDFQVLWLGETVSQLGSSMSFFVFPMLGYAVSGSTAQAALVEAAYASGRVVTQLPAGVLVDRWSRHAVLLGASGRGTLLYASLAVATLTGVLTIPHLLAVALLTGIAGTFFHPAETAAIRQVVSREDLPSAMAQNQARMHVASLVGAPLGGALYSIGRWIPFAVDALTYGISCLAIAQIRTPLPAPSRRHLDGGDEVRGMRREVAERLRFVWASPFFRVLLLYAAVHNAATLGFSVVLTLRLVQAGVHPAAIGLIETAAAAAGIAGAVAAPSILRRIPTGWLAIASAWVWVPATMPMPYTMNVAAIGALLATAVFLNPVGNAALSSYRIAITPDHLQGRGQTATNFLASVAMPLGPLIGGLLMERLGSTVTLNVVIAALTAGALLLTASRAVRSVPRPRDWLTAPDLP